MRERLARITDRGREREDTPEKQGGGGKTARERLKDILDRDSAEGPQAVVHKLDGHSELEKGVEPAQNLQSGNGWTMC